MRRTRTTAGWERTAMLAAAMLGLAATAPAAPATRVILMIGDGMGLEHVKAAGHFVHGRDGSLFMETLPHRAQVVTCSYYEAPTNAGAAKAEPKVTDSAAAATAMATGHKVYNGVLSVAMPGDNRPYTTALEMAAAAGKRTGLVTTSFLSDATPAAFATHVKLRGLQKEVAEGMLNKGRPNLMLGGCSREKNVPLTPAGGAAAGYRVATNRETMTALLAENPERVLGLFGSGGPLCYEHDYATKARRDYDQIPHLTEMTTAALEYMDREPKGFFLMIEGGCIDKAAHGNNLERNVHETAEFDRAVALAAAWAAKHEDTLLIVTADHETGGMKVVSGNGEGKMPEVKWSSKGHSNANVGIFATGPGSEKIQGVLDNTDVFRLITGTFEAPTPFVPPAGDGTPPPKADNKD